MTTNTNSVYDVRVIRLIKSTQRNNLARFYNSKIDCNICLGHFDVMWVDGLPSGTCNRLEAIQSDSNVPWGHNRRGTDGQGEIPGIGEENFSYPLYILRQYSPANSEQSANCLDKFWDKKTTYTVVTRFHCDAMGESEPFSELLTSRLKMERSTNSGSSLCVGESDGIGDTQILVRFSNQTETIETRIWVTFYDSLELGDVVGIVKGDSIAAILEVQRHLYESKWVSDAYSYCGIHKDYFHAGNKEFAQMLERSGPLLDCAQLNYISTRFSVNHVEKTEAYLDTMEQLSGVECGERYFVTGTADLIIDWSQRSETDFLKIMRYLVRSGSAMYSAFNDIITRIGLAHTKPVKGRTNNPDRKDFADKVPQYHNILALLNDPVHRYPWGYQLLKLLGTLHTMYDNCVMDDLSALLVPGVSALLDRICHLQGKGLWKDEYDKEIFEFLDYWALLTNDISHLESQLVQHPELSPVRYFIPAMVLQYEQRCVRDCANILQHLDVEGVQSGYTFAPILIPYAGENTSTRCILDPWHDDLYTQAAPLRILLPISKLYQPWKIAHILCHEVAHYCGNIARHREERLTCLTKCAAIYLLQLMDSCIDFPQSTASAGKQDFLAKISETLNRNFLTVPEPSSSYLSYVRKYLPWAVWSVCEDPHVWESYQNLYLSDLPAEKQLQYVSKLNSFSNRINMAAALKQYCEKHITECLIPICKECYADIVMILLLDCSFQDYYTCVFQDEYIRLSSKAADPTDPNILELYEPHIDRLALVSLVISDNLLKGTSWLTPITKETDPWTQTAKKKIEYWQKRTAKMGQNREGSTQDWPKPTVLNETIHVHDLSSDSVQELLGYLSLCARELNSQIKGTDNLHNAQKQLQVLISLTQESGFNWNEIRRLLQSHT